MGIYLDQRGGFISGHKGDKSRKNSNEFHSKTEGGVVFPVGFFQMIVLNGQSRFAAGGPNTIAVCFISIKYLKIFKIK